jgi:predicted dehydrogenase
MASEINRRDFLKGSALASTFTLVGSRAIAEEPAGASPAGEAGRTFKANDEIHVAIVGIRSQGKSHIGWHAGIKGVRVVTLGDVDERLFADRIKLAGERPPKTETDIRRVLDDKDVDCISIAMPNHWHAPATVWACQAGKDVYVEKPASYSIWEGRRMIEAARKYNRVVQVGTHIRAKIGRQEAMKLLKEGIIGKLYMARAYVFNPRKGIGRKDDCPVPRGVHYDLWLGPAPVRPFNPNRFHYEWHWNWEYGNGEIGNNGPHMTDIAIEGLDKQTELPTRVYSHGGRYVWDDQGQTPNIQQADYQYADGTLLTLDIRNLESMPEAAGDEGVIFSGSKGCMSVTVDGSYQTKIDNKPGPKGSNKSGAHPQLVKNFHDVVRSRKMSDLLAPTEYGHTGAALCHLGNISYRLGRSLKFDPKTETFPNDPEANTLLTREYRKPFVVPEQV